MHFDVASSDMAASAHPLLWFPIHVVNHGESAYRCSVDMGDYNVASYIDHVEDAFQSVPSSKTRYRHENS
jgi:hypothetical protein